MRVSIKKFLLTGSAIVAVSAFAAGSANAAPLTFTGGNNTIATGADTWDLSTQSGFTNSSLTWNGAGAVSVTATGAATANIGALTVTSVAGANSLSLGNNTTASILIVNGNISGDVASNDLTIAVNATGNAASSTLNLKGATNTLGTGNGITLDSGTGGGVASVLFTGTGAQAYTGSIRGAAAGDGVLSVTNTGGTVTFNDAIGSTALGHIGIGGASGTSTVVFNNTVTVANTSGSTSGDGAIVLGQTDGGGSNTTFKNTVTANSIGLGVAGAGVDTNTVTFDATGGSFSVSAALAGATAADTNNLVILGGATRVVTLAGGSNIDNISLNQTGTALTLTGNTGVSGSTNFDQAGILNINGSTLSSAIDIKNTASTINLGTGGHLTGNIISTGGANGTLNFSSGNTLTGYVGFSAGSGLATVAFNNTTGNTANVSGNIYATNINLTSTGSAVVVGSLNGNVNISGTGGLTTWGTVTGNTAFSAAGTLTVGNSGGVGAGIVGAVTTTTNNTGTLAFVGTGTNTVSGGVGTNGFALNTVSIGAGTVTFQSAGFYAQTLSFSSAGSANLVAAGTSVGGQAINFGGNAGTVVLADNVNYSGTASSTGGTGNMTLGANSTLSGTIGTGGNKLGTVRFTSGSNNIATSAIHATTTDVAAATAVTVKNTSLDSNLNFSGAGSTVTFSSANSIISGNVSATTPGQGTLAYAGTLNINGSLGRIGTLSVVPGNLTIGSNATAADAMNIDVNTVNVNGTFATTANTALTYRVNTPTTSGKIIATGNLTVDANTAVSMIVDTNVYVAQNQQFLLIDGNDAGTGVATLAGGKLTTTDTTLLHFKQDLTNTHDLVVYADRTQINNVASNSNNAAVGTMLDALGGSANTQINAFQVALGQQTTSAGVNNLLGTVVAPVDGSVTAVNEASSTISDVIGGRIGDVGMPGSFAPAPAAGIFDKESGKSGGNDAPSNNLWGQAFGASAKQGQRNGAAGYDVGSYGFVVGADKPVSDQLLAGISIAYARTNVNAKDLNLTGTDVDSYQAGVYGVYDFGGGYFATGQVSYMYNDIETVRYNVGGVGSQVARANPHSSQYSVRTEAGRSVAVDNSIVLTPSATANYSYTNMSTYSESGAGGLSLANVNPDDPSLLELGARLRAEANLKDDAGGTIQPGVSVGYRYDLAGDRASSVASLVGGGTAFNTTGASPSRGTVEAGVGVTWVSPYSVDVRAEYDYEHKSEYNAHSGYVRAGVKF